MTQANETGTDEPHPQFASWREISAMAGAEQRGSRVLLRIPDCTSRLSTVSRESAGWWVRWQAFADVGGPWFDLVRPVLPPRVLAAGAIGILLGVVLIVLTPAEKRLPAIRSHAEHAAATQRPPAPAPPPQTLVEPNGPRANVGTTGAGNAATTATVEPNAAAKIDAVPPPRYENARRPDETPPAPGKGWAELEGRLN